MQLWGSRRYLGAPPGFEKWFTKNRSKTKKTRPVYQKLAGINSKKCNNFFKKLEAKIIFIVKTFHENVDVCLVNFC
jgi:hypothetical protein